MVKSLYNISISDFVEMRMRNMRAVEIFSEISEAGMNIFSIIQQQGPLTKNDLLAKTKMKLTTLNRVMKPLEERGLIREIGSGDSSGGRKPVLYDVDDIVFFAIGVDISRTYTKIVLINFKIQCLAEETFLMDEDCSPQKTVDLIAQAVEHILQKHRIQKKQVLGIGVGTIGPIDISTGTMMFPKYFLSTEWNQVPLEMMLKQATGLYIQVENGANTAVMAEVLYGRGKDIRNVAYIHCGIGIRTGVISASQMIRNTQNLEDAFAHMVVDMDGEQCECGNYGCIQCYATILAITAHFVSERKKGKKSLLQKPLHELDYMGICEAAEKQDPLASEVISNAAVVFGIGLANYMSILDPHLIILSGPLIAHSRLFYEVCSNTALEKSYLKPKHNITFSRGGYFKEKAIAVGAAILMTEKLIQERHQKEGI